MSKVHRHSFSCQKNHRSTIPWRANVRVAAHIEKRCGNYSSTMRRNGGFNKEPRDFTINVTHVNWTNNGIWFGHGSPKPIVEGHVQKGSCLFVGPKLPWALMARVDPQPKTAGLLAPFHPHYAPYFLPYLIDAHRIIISYVYIYVCMYACMSPLYSHSGP